MISKPEDFSYADFTGQVLSGFDFRRDDLSCANFFSAVLTKAMFSGANVEGTDFRSAWLEGAEMKHLDF